MVGSGEREREREPETMVVECGCVTEIEMQQNRMRRDAARNISHEGGRSRRPTGAHCSSTSCRDVFALLVLTKLNRDTNPRGRVSSASTRTLHDRHDHTCCATTRPPSPWAHNGRCPCVPSPAKECSSLSRQKCASTHTLTHTLSLSRLLFRCAASEPRTGAMRDRPL